MTLLYATLIHSAACPDAALCSCCREETHCRFCNSKYQLDWRNSLSGPQCSQQQVSSTNSRPAAAPEPRRPPTPIMAIIFEGQVHRIKVGVRCSLHAPQHRQCSNIRSAAAVLQQQQQS
jgi:hypothetical protein